MTRGPRILVVLLVTAAAATMAGCTTGHGAATGGTNASRRPASPAATPTAAAGSPAPSVSAGPSVAGALSPKPPASGTGIAGITILSGNCPVLTEQPCFDRPVPARLSVTDTATGAVVASVSSGGDGQFSVATQPGRFTVRAVDMGGAPPRGFTSVTVTVEAGRYTTVTLTFAAGPHP
jgi:hypothetical protein